jgi:polygalacturonase
MMIKKTLVTSIVIVFLALLALPLRSYSVPSTYNIQKYGAIGDSSVINTKFIQSAIDDCAKAGGGTVYFPAGKYISGTLFLKSNITLFLEAGAVLIGSGTLNDYPVTVSGIRSFTDNYTDKSLIYGEGLEHIGIIGDGIIDGNGTSFKGEYKVRPYMIRIINCKDVLVRDITLINSPMWVQHYLACENVIIDGVNVDCRRDFVNNDGIDIDGCKNVRISNCDFKSGDDGVVLKSTLNQPCENITVTNCIISSNCNGFKLGTETNGGFENITFSNSVIYDTKFGGISLELVDGGNLDRVTVTNISMNNVGAAIFIRLGNRARPFIEKMEKPGIGKLSNVMISNIQASNVGNIGCSITGLPGFPVKNISLNHIRLSFQGGGTKEFVNREIPELPEKYPEYRMFGMLPAYGFYCRHAENVTFNDVDVSFIEPEARPAIVCDDITGVEFYRIKAMPVSIEPLLRFNDVKNAFLQSNIAPEGTETFLKVTGTKSDHIVLTGNDLSGAKNQVSKDTGIDVCIDSKQLK